VRARYAYAGCNDPSSALCQHFIEQFDQWSQVVRASVPDDHRVNLIVAMHDPIAHAAHQSPGDFRMCLQYGFWNVPSSFADDRQIRHHGLEGPGSARNCSRFIPAIKDPISAMAAKISSILSCQLLSDTDGLLQNPLSPGWSQAPWCAEIHFAPEGLLQEQLQTN
jgi:hypothetical protein